MQKKHKHKLIISLLYTTNGNSIMDLDKPVEVRLPGDTIYTIYRLGICPDFELWIGDGGGNWAPLEATDINYDRMLEAVWPIAASVHIKKTEVAA